MPCQITWLTGAARDIDRLRDFLKSKNPLAAQRAAKHIIEGVNILTDNPAAGVSVEELVDYRELILPFGSGEYIVRYRLEGEQVVIVRVRHSREESF